MTLPDLHAALVDLKVRVADVPDISRADEADIAERIGDAVATVESVMQEKAEEERLRAGEWRDEVQLGQVY